MKKLFTILMSLFLVLSLAACSSGNEEAELTNIGTFEKYTLELNDAEFTTNESGENVIKVDATYMNDDSEPQYALSSFAVRAFQNDVELTDISNINGDEVSLIQEVKNGASIGVTYVFVLDDDSEVEVLIGEPTADQTTVGQQTYTVNK